MATLRIVFCGTPDFAVPSLRLLASRPEFSIESVITQPDRPRGRGHQVSASEVKEAATQLGLRIFQPETVKSESAQDFLKRVSPDAVVIIAYGQIIPARLLPLPRLGWINLHASLLPRYRGAAPMQWAIANGDEITGLTAMQIDAGMDTGPTLARREVAIGETETAPQLAMRMSVLGAELIAESLIRFDRGELSLTPQDNNLASHAPMLKKEDGRIDWSRTARQIYNRMRGFAPWPGAFSTFRGQTYHLWGQPFGDGAGAARPAPGEIALVSRELLVGCGEQTCLRLESVQAEGRKKITAGEFANGARIISGDRFV